MATLHLPLKRKWFDMIKADIKLEEYREIGEYWNKRLIGESKPFPIYFKSYEEQKIFKKFDKLVFTLGYPKAGDSSRRLEFKNPKIRIGTGRPEWGAVPGKKYFVITWDQE